MILPARFPGHIFTVDAIALNINLSLIVMNVLVLILGYFVFALVGSTIELPYSLLVLVPKRMENWARVLPQKQQKHSSILGCLDLGLSNMLIHPNVVVQLLSPYPNRAATYLLHKGLTQVFLYPFYLSLSHCGS